MCATLSATRDEHIGTRVTTIVPAHRHGAGGALALARPARSGPPCSGPAALSRPTQADSCSMFHAGVRPVALGLRFVAATADQTTPEQRRPTPRRRPGHAGLSDTLTEILTMTFEIRVRNNSNDKICFNSISCCAWMRFNISRGQRRTKRTRPAKKHLSRKLACSPRATAATTHARTHRRLRRLASPAQRRSLRSLAPCASARAATTPSRRR